MVGLFCLALSNLSNYWKGGCMVGRVFLISGKNTDDGDFLLKAKSSKVIYWTRYGTWLNSIDN